MIVAARALISDHAKEGQLTSAIVKLNKYSMLGTILGPCVGGLLAEPNQRLPESVRLEMWEKFPFLLPCLGCCALAVTTCIFVYCYAQDVPKSKSPLLPPTSPVHSPLSHLRTNRAYLSAVITWSFCALTGSMFVELLGLWCKTDKSLGGLGWREEWKVSIVLITGSITLLLYLSTVLRPLITRIGTGLTLRGALLVMMLSYALMPWISSLPSVCVWPCIILCMPLWSMSSGSAITSINIIINSVVPQELYGAANGLGISLVALIRAFGPITAGALLGWAISDRHPFPLNHCLPFYTAAGITCLNLLFVRRAILV